jgi:hypothetical protein
MSSEQLTPGEKVRQALTAYSARKSRCPKFVAYLSRLDAVQFHVVLYLLTKVKISASVIPELWPLSEPHRFEKMLNTEIAELVRMNGDEPGRH